MNIPGENTLPPVPGPLPITDQEQRIRRIEERLCIIEAYLRRKNFYCHNTLSFEDGGD